MTTNKINQFFSLTKKHFRTYLGIAISVFLFILFFQPFTIERFEFENILLFIAGFGLIVLIILVVSQIIFQRHLMKVDEEIGGNRIYMSLYFFSQVAAASVAFVFYIRYVGQNNITFNIVVRVIFICICFPITIYLKNKLDSYQARLKKLLHETRKMQDKLKQCTESYVNKYVDIISENDSDNFRIQVSEIVYVKSANNYVEFGYRDGGGVKKKMVRNTLRNIEHQLREFNNFIRTHRTSLVNVQYINELNKNFSSYWLSLDDTKETVPVSRQYLMAVKDLL